LGRPPPAARRPRPRRPPALSLGRVSRPEAFPSLIAT